MKKSWRLAALFFVTFCLTGCGEKFEPTESTIYVTEKGEVKSAVMESFEEDYYDFSELTDEVEDEVRAYCLDKNEEVMTVESLTQSDDMVTLLMNYQTVGAYAEFNETLLFNGTMQEAVKAGYIPEMLYDTEGQETVYDAESMDGLKVIITDENVCIQTSGKIKYVSDNAILLDKKLAKAVETGKSHPAFVIYK